MVFLLEVVLGNTFTGNLIKSGQNNLRTLLSYGICDFSAEEEKNIFILIEEIPAE